MKDVLSKKDVLAPLYSKTHQKIAQKTFSLPNVNIKWREPLLIFASWRMLLLLLPFLGVLVAVPTERDATSPYIIPNFYTGTADFWTDRFLAAWGRWDGEWYLQIVNHGYNPPDGAPAFFPIYPLLVKIAGIFLSENYMLAGVLVSALASIAVFILFYNLTLRDFKDNQLARLATLVLAVFPMAFFLGAIYTEALFLAFTLAAFYCVRHLKNWWLGAIFAALATLTRNVGIVVAVALVWEWWMQQRQSSWFQFKPQSFRKLGLVLGLPVGALLIWFSIVWYMTGDPMMFIKAQSSQYWHRQSAAPWTTVWQAIEGLTSSATGSESNWTNFIFLVVWLVFLGLGAWLVWQRRYPVSYMLFFVLAFLPGLCAPRADQPLFALPRYVLVLFPLFQIIALLLPRQLFFRVGYLMLSGAGLVYFTIRFVQWYWVG